MDAHTLLIVDTVVGILTLILVAVGRFR